MDKRRIQIVALVALGLYALATGHQLLPHAGSHEENGGCFLCLVMTTAAIPVAVASLCAVLLPVTMPALRASGVPPAPVRATLSLRAPPIMPS